MLRRSLTSARLLTLTTMFAVAIGGGLASAPGSAHATERTKEELKALKKVMKQWSKALGVKCKHCHNTKDFKEWTPQREVALAMSELFTKKLKPPAGGGAPGGAVGAGASAGAGVTCSDCHEKSLKPDPAKIKRFKAADLKALAPAFKARSASVKTEEAKKVLDAVADYLGKL